MSAKEDQSLANKTVIEALRNQGDTLTEVREIEHWAYFPTTLARAQFIEKCLAAGLRLRTTFEREHSSARLGARVSSSTRTFPPRSASTS